MSKALDNMETGSFPGDGSALPGPAGGQGTNLCPLPHRSVCSQVSQALCFAPPFLTVL